nr:hypothetical protein [Bacteroidota bacterium]
MSEPLAGLDGLDSVGGNLEISNNEVLATLAALENLSSIAGTLIIGGEFELGTLGNPSLVSLAGLESIEPNSITNLEISYNSSLSECHAQSICDFLVSPIGEIEIHDNAPGCNSQEEVIEACESSCLPEGITFTTQSEIDNFQINYPNCTEIEGDVGIGEWPGSDITNLNGLSVLTSIGGDLHIQQNPLLMDLSGLDNLISIWELWVLENESLQNLTGLNNLSSIYGEISISSNEELTSLTGLEGLNSIESLRISNPSLVNLDGLNNLINVNDLLEISYNSSLQSLSGLESLTTIGGRLSIINNNALVYLSGLDNLSTVEGDLTIGSYGINAIPGGLYCEGNSTLTDLTALSNLTNIGGNLGIFCDDTLTNLSGLENLSAIGGGLHIGYYWGWQSAGNPSLTSITGLEGLTSIEGDIEIQGNLSLKSLTGLENIEATTIENIIIRYNDSLSYCEVQSVCNYLSDPGGVVEIYGNATGCNDPAEIANACGTTMSCLPYGKYCFTYQTAIDSFQYWYPGCSALEGKVFISGKDITNLGGLGVVTSIGSTLQVRDTDSLPNLTGLDNVVSIGGDLLIGDVWSGPNESLTSLTGLENLTSIGGNIDISGNNVLASLAGIDNINAGSVISLEIFHNDTLSACAVQSICDYLAIHNLDEPEPNREKKCNFRAWNY